jgi:EAL and modified HD-GYP domain-containing signal transduction protein
MGVQSAGTTVFVARQPVFDCAKRSFGYELLCHCRQESGGDTSDAETSMLDVLASGLLPTGLDELTGGKLAFLRLTRKLQAEDIAALPSDRVILEIHETIKPDEEILNICRELKAAGYRLALDDFVMSASGSSFLDLADIVKVDFLATAPGERKKIALDLDARGIKALAREVESDKAFEEAVACGYSYVEGCFFAKPAFRATDEISGNKLSRLRVLDELYLPEVSYDRLEEIIKQDVSLTYDLLRFINSAWFGLRYKITAIKHALVLLGPKEIKKWFALVTLQSMGTEKPSELLLRCMTRAKMGELMAPLVGMRSHAPGLFLMGMFSVIDALVDAPMPAIVAKLPLDDQIKGALLGHSNLYRTVLDAIVSY